MSEKTAYNLRSGGSETVTVPLQFEVSDKNFMSRFLQSQQSTSQSGQVLDSDSGSENNSNMSNAESDNEDTQGSESTGVDKQVRSSLNAFRDQNTDTVSQQAINLQILSQLGDIRCLHVIENKKPKKSSDTSKIKNKSTKAVRTHTPVTLPPTQVSAQPLPDLQYLRNDVYIQAQVEQRLKNLVEDSKSGTKIKSLRGGAVKVVVPNRIKWPQEYVLAGSV